MDPQKNLYHEDDEAEFDRALDTLRAKGVDLGDLDHEGELEDGIVSALMFDPRCPRKYDDVVYSDEEPGFDIVGGVNR